MHIDSTDSIVDSTEVALVRAIAVAKAMRVSLQDGAKDEINMANEIEIFIKEKIVFDEAK